MNLTFDGSINIPTIIAVAGWIVFVIKVWLNQRDINRDVTTIIGKRHPREERTGLLGEIAALHEVTAFHDDLIDLHHRQLGLDRRTQAERRHTGNHAALEG